MRILKQTLYTRAITLCRERWQRCDIGVIVSVAGTLRGMGIIIVILRILIIPLNQHGTRYCYSFLVGTVKPV